MQGLSSLGAEGPSPTRLPSRRFDGFSVSLIDLPCTGESAFSEKSSGPENLTRPPRPRQIVSAVYHRHLVAPPNLHRSPNRIARNLLNRCHPPIAKGGWHRLNAAISVSSWHGRPGHACIDSKRNGPSGRQAKHELPARKVGGTDRERWVALIEARLWKAS